MKAQLTQVLALKGITKESIVEKLETVIDVFDAVKKALPGKRIWENAKLVVVVGFLRWVLGLLKETVRE